MSWGSPAPHTVWGLTTPTSSPQGSSASSPQDAETGREGRVGQGAGAVAPPRDEGSSGAVRQRAAMGAATPSRGARARTGAWSRRPTRKPRHRRPPPGVQLSPWEQRAVLQFRGLRAHLSPCTRRPHPAPLGDGPQAASPRPRGRGAEDEHAPSPRPAEGGPLAETRHPPPLRGIFAWLLRMRPRATEAPPPMGAAGGAGRRALCPCVKRLRPRPAGIAADQPVVACDVLVHAREVGLFVAQHPSCLPLLALLLGALVEQTTMAIEEAAHWCIEVALCRFGRGRRPTPPDPADSDLHVQFTRPARASAPGCGAAGSPPAAAHGPRPDSDALGQSWQIQWDLAAAVAEAVYCVQANHPEMLALSARAVGMAADYIAESLERAPPHPSERNDEPAEVHGEPPPGGEPGALPSREAPRGDAAPSAAPLIEQLLPLLLLTRHHPEFSVRHYDLAVAAASLARVHRQLPSYLLPLLDGIFL